MRSQKFDGMEGAIALVSEDSGEAQHPGDHGDRDGSHEDAAGDGEFGEVLLRHTF